MVSQCSLYSLYDKRWYLEVVTTARWSLQSGGLYRGGVHREVPQYNGHFGTGGYLV